jgi:hypothetical protein
VTQPRSTFDQNEYELRHSRNDPYINKFKRTPPMQFAIQDNQMTETLERPIVPAGIRTMSILAAEEGPNDYKISDENPDGQCLKLRLTDASGGFKFIFDDIPKHLGWRAQQLAQAVGIIPVGTTLAIVPDELIGRHLLVEVSHYTSKAGKVSAVVKKYLPMEPGKAPKSERVASVPRQTAAQKVTASLPDDEIPF